MRNTMRKVTMVVPVLITNCQVSLYLKIGPVTAQITIVANARRKAMGFPVQSAVAFAKRENRPPDLLGVPPVNPLVGRGPGIDSLRVGRASNATRRREFRTRRPSFSENSAALIAEAR